MSYRQNEIHHELGLTQSQIQADMHHVTFYFREKTGTPKLFRPGLAFRRDRPDGDCSPLVLVGYGLALRSFDLLDKTILTSNASVATRRCPLEKVR